MSKILKNAAPKRYRTKFIEPGIADYSAEGFGKVLVSKEALDKMLPSYVGKYVIVQHNDMTQEEAFNFTGGEDTAHGVVSAVGYDEKSGWYWADLVIWDEEAQACIDEKGFSVSCAYDVNDADRTGGSYHAIQYDQEVLEGEYTHMAIVDNPRYEGATIVQNSKEADVIGGNMAIKTKKKRVFKFLGKEKVANEEPAKKPEEEEEEVMNASDCVEMENGEKVPVSELVENYNNRQNADKEETENLLNMEDEVDVGDGKKVKVSDLVSSYKSRENAEPALDEEAEDVVDTTKQMQNSKKTKNSNFKKVENASHIESTPKKPYINTKTVRLERGQERYSLKKEGTK